MVTATCSRWGSVLSGDNRSRIAAVNIVAKLLRRQGSLNTLLPAETADLDPRQSGHARELCFGCCRYYPLLCAVLAQLLRKPLKRKDADINAILLLGLYQLMGMGTADYAAVNESVKLAAHYKKPWAKSLINGVLRGFQRDSEAMTNRARRVSHTLHPAWLEQTIQQAWGARAGEIYWANNQHPPFTLRVNQQQYTRRDYLQKLNDRGIATREARFSPVGLYLAKATAVTDLPGFAEGAVSVQDEAAQLAPGLLLLQPGLRVLDACSAPGGKTGHLGESENNLKIVALDNERRRLEKVAENLARLSIEADIIHGDARAPGDWWDGNPFDRILLDAPCSATGIIRRQPDIKLLRQPEHIEAQVRVQWQLLTSLWGLLAEGGILLYATCSILPRENTQMLQQFLAVTRNAQELPIVADWGVAQPVGRQLLPGIDRDGPDGFYYGRLTKINADAIRDC